jgi:hypothetical protein
MSYPHESFYFSTRRSINKTRTPEITPVVMATTMLYVATDFSSGKPKVQEGKFDYE